MSRWKAEILLFLAPLIWGASFAVTKGSLDSIGPNWVLAFRFVLAAIAMTVIVIPRIKKIDRRAVIAGILIGVLLYLIQLTQTVGMVYTTAGRSAFLTATYVVMTPFVVWAFYKTPPTVLQVIGGIISLFGVGLISLHDGMAMGKGEVLNLIAGAICAISYVATEKAGDMSDVLLFTWVQLLTCAGISTIAAGLTEPFTWNIGRAGWMAMLFLGVASSCFSVVFQNLGLKYADSNHASLVFALEAVFGVFFGVIMLGERLEARMLAGSAIVFFAIILCSLPSREKSAQKKAEI